MEILKKSVLMLLFIGIVSISLNAQSNIAEAFKDSYTQENKGEYSAAVIDLKKVYQKDSYAINLRLAWLSYLAGQYTESVSYYKKSISLKPLSIEALMGLTYPAAAMGNWEQVINAYLEVLKIDKANYTANLKLGQIYMSRTKYEIAEPYFKLLINQYPFTYDVVLNTAWNNYYLGRFREAKILFNKVLWLSPNDTSAMDGLSKIQ